MRLAELDLPVPEELIAQSPVEPRDRSRLLRLDRRSGRLSHHTFRDLPGLLRPGDVLVVNDSRVLAARVFMRKPTGGRAEILFLRPAGGGTDDRSGNGRLWEVLARPSGRLKAGTNLIEGDLDIALLSYEGEGRWLVHVAGEEPTADLLCRYGVAPLPPYIREPLADADRYQTVYCREGGSAAAPTAGLHFTPRLLTELGDAGIGLARVTLHVGLDTFRPIQAEVVEEHDIHSEHYSVEPEHVRLLDRARRDGRRTVAVGTTSVRVLETLYGGSGTGEPATGPLAGQTSLYITPGYEFRAVDVMITNFHLPRTSLLALVMAFAGVEGIRGAYAEAVDERYRFFSFGDAMLIE